MPDRHRENLVGKDLLGDLVERIAALSPAHLYDYVVPKVPAWEAETTFMVAVTAAAQRAEQGRGDWPVADV